MKFRHTYILSSLLAATMLLWGCGGEEEPVEATFSVSPETIEIDALGGQETVGVISSEDWVASSSQSWAKPLIVSGKASSTASSIPISIGENSAAQERTAVITVKTMSLKTLTVTVKQSGNNGEISEERGIFNINDLKNFATAINEGKSTSKYMADGKVVLLQDIDVSSISDWTPIGTATRPFVGVFDGQGHSITGVKWTVDASAAADCGLFGYAGNSTVKNLVFGKEGDCMTISGTCASDGTAAGICGRATSITVSDVVNNVDVKFTGSCKAMGMGGLCGIAQSGQITTCTNNGSVEFLGSCTNGASLDMGGFCGSIEKGQINSCNNNGNVISCVACRAGGFCGTSYVTVKLCVNRGCILSDSKDGNLGPAWGCAYNPETGTFITNEGYGHVGSYTQYSADPSKAPDAMFKNAIVSPDGMFDTEATTVDWTLDSYYDWTPTATKTLCKGCTYTKYECTNVPRKVCVLEIDLTSSEVDITTAYSDDIVPNPNANKNNNSGKNVRETLSEICTRKRAEGQNIIAGVNSGFFESNEGYSRGPHIEEGEPVYVNQPSVRQNLPNHAWAFTVFTDGTASCGKKNFYDSSYGRAGTFKIGGKEFDYWSINEVILKSVNTSYPANIYTYRYVKTPHPTELPNVQNTLATNAYYLVCKFTGDIMRTNQGYAAATVTAIYDGRTAALSEGPYVTGKKEFVIQLCGDVASTVSSLASVGAEVQIKADMAIDGVTKPIYTQNSTMFEFMVNGEDASNSCPAGHSNLTTYDPVTLAAVSQDAKKVWIIEVDGRQDWYSMGLKSYEMYRFAKKLGAWNMTRFDGGGSACMWVYDSATGKGGLVSSPSDSKGERSCMNYLLIRKKQ